MTKTTKSTKTTKQTSQTVDTGGTATIGTSNGYAAQVGQTLRVDPGTLLMERNVRNATADEDLVKSLRAVGMLEPITAVVTDSGALLVRHGHRRTLAAVDAGVQALVYLSGVDATDDKSEIDRVIAQRDENTHRLGLTTAEDVGAVAQLAAFGLSANQIARRSRIKRQVVDDALAVAGSDLARKATERWDSLTLDQAAAVAEFDDDADTAKALIAAAHSGRFEHVLQRARDDRERATAREAALAPVRDTGVSVIDAPGWMDRSTLPLDSIRLDPHTEPGTITTDSTKHAECPGHVAWAEEYEVLVDAEGNEVDEDEPRPEGEDDDPDVAAYDPRLDAATYAIRYRPVYGCQNWQERGHVALWQRCAAEGDHTVPTMSPDQAASAENAATRQAAQEAEAETKRAHRRLVIENNKAWDAAETVRIEALKVLAKRKTPPKGTGTFLATTLCRDGHLLGTVSGNHLAAEWLGADEPFGYGYASTAADQAAEATEGRATVIALIQVLATHEADLTRDSWRRDGTDSAVGRYLRFLADATGYTLSEVEEYAISAETA